MVKVKKIITGNESGGAAQAIQILIDGIFKNKDDSLDFKVICLCNGVFAKKIKNLYNNDVVIMDSPDPPILYSRFLLIKVFHLFKLCIWFFDVLYNLTCLLKDESIDYIHTTNNLALYISSMYCIFSKSKLISSWRSVGIEHSLIGKLIYNRIDIVVCVSDAVKQSLSNKLKNKAIVIYDGLNIKSLINDGTKNKKRLREYLKVDEDTIVFGTIGTFSEIKCHDSLIESCNLLANDRPNLKFVCVLFGSSPNPYCLQYFNYLKMKVLKYNLSDKVIFITDQSLGKPSSLIIDFDFFIGSTWNYGRGEGFGLIYVEAMAQKLPIIAISVGAAPELISNSSGILLNSKSPIIQMKAIEEMIDDKESLTKMSLESYKNAFKYDISFTVRYVLNLYR